MNLGIMNVGGRITTNTNAMIWLVDSTNRFVSSYNCFDSVSSNSKNLYVHWVKIVSRQTFTANTHAYGWQT